MAGSALLVAIGDIHGRFERIEVWLRQLAEAHGRPIDLAIAVGDLETFARADAPLRKRSKRTEPAEFGAYARGERQMPCPVVFIGGNNEDFAALHAIPRGGELAPGFRYLGRAGRTRLAGLETAFVSGIYAPTSFAARLEPPHTLELARRAGHFRASELEVASTGGPVSLLLLHDWPRGLVTRLPAGAPPSPPGFWGNVAARALVEQLRPEWVLCGHQHRAWAATLVASRVACLDEADRPDGALLWLEVEDGGVKRVGWGARAEPAWRAREPWDWRNLPR